ncbi:uncharacterized protein DEA37_0001140 [Paragonimus westermani]|uniref:Uncharacterized protein n=1 Tax=Paragonimus westermani TaxID=34504 RepID=A0A5J4P0B5_9TREM|nr:uncharacterized protein DEA37_0001140 [Paragonimus westermani]
MAEVVTRETEFDVYEDLEKPSCLMKLRQEMEQKQTLEEDTYSRAGRSSELVRRRSSANTRRASIRRTSMREKKMTSWKEAKQEAEMLGLSPVTLGLDAQAGINGAMALTTLNEMMAHQIHVTSPAKMNIENSSGSPDPTSQTDHTALDTLSEQTTLMSLGNLAKGTGNSLEFTSHSTINSSTNEQTRSSDGATSPPTTSPPSRVQESRSTDSTCTEKLVSDGVELSNINRGFLDPEHKSNRRPTDTVSSQSEKSPCNPISQVCPDQASTVAAEMHILTNPCLVSESHVQASEQTNNHIGDSGTANSPLLTSTHSEPLRVCSLPQNFRRPSGSTNCRQSAGSSSSSANESDCTGSQLPTYSAPFCSPLAQMNDIYINSTRKQDSSCSPPTGIKQKSTHLAIHSTNSLSRKTNMELIEYDSHQRSSGKCCTLI